MLPTPTPVGKAIDRAAASSSGVPTPPVVDPGARLAAANKAADRARKAGAGSGSSSTRPRAIARPPALNLNPTPGSRY